MMDARLLRYYERELQHLRETGGEFAREFPKIAGRLGLETYACADPYVERLLEGFSFLAARIQLKIDAEFPRFTNHLLELVYPHYLAPTPSMAVVQMQPDLSEGGLASGFPVVRGTALRGLLGKDDQTSCEFRTAHDVTLLPIELVEAKYFTYAGEIGGLSVSRLGPIHACLRLRLRATADLTFKDIALDSLPLYLRGSGSVPARLLEHLLAASAGVVVMPAKPVAGWHEVVAKSHIRHLGLDDEHALLPVCARAFQGYRLLHEYFAFPQRYLFVEFGGLATAVRRCEEREMDIVVLFNRLDPSLEQIIAADNFGLFCTPAINLFPKRADRVHLADGQSEYHVVPDRSRPLDFEVYRIVGVRGYGTGADAEQEFLPFYYADDLQTGGEEQGYYQLRRAPRLLSERQRRAGPRSSYVGSEVFLSLVDPHEAPYRSGLRQLGLETLCTNRDLVLGMSLGSGKTDFTSDSGAPLKSVRCLSGPSVPSPSYAEGETAWRLVNHLSLNYLSLLDGANGEGAEALKNLLRLYATVGDAASHRQIDGVRTISASSIVRRLPVPGPICHGRGLQIKITLDDDAFEGLGAFPLGAVLDRFFAKYVGLNSFTETVVATTKRGELMRWPTRGGRCEIL